MSPSIQFKTTTSLLLLILGLAWFGLSPKVLATDLGSVLPNANTADGSGVLVSLTGGVNNSGFGFQALNHDNSGNANTATVLRALFSNTAGSSNTANGDAALYNDAVNAMLLNEFLKEHCKVEEQSRKIQEQEATITELKSNVAQQNKDMKVFAANLKEQASQIQKVSAQLEVSKSAPQMVGCD
jgi:uncharacterized coiled-coil protein SlyX